ncbi:hypothetical protein ACIGG6_05645 [Vreelandella lionensis]|uniref:Response regulatory domain-containing protein n=1 Tax=Vreelandella lionensis TaxID=1144478 RepID=A0ABW8BTA6_9GAMM
MTRNVLIIEDNPGIGELVRMHVAELDRVLRLEMGADDYLKRGRAFRPGKSAVSASGCYGLRLT